MSDTTEARVLAQRQRLAWAVTTVALLVFGVGLSGTAWAANALYRSAGVEETVRLQVYGGTVLVRGARTAGWAGAPPDSLLSVGDHVRADATAQALLRLFDGSTVRLFGGSEVRIEGMTRRRFVAGPDVLQLSVLRGQVHIGVAPVADRIRDLAVPTARGRVRLEEGSYGIREDNGVLELKVQERGQAVVTQGGESVVVPPDHRLEIPPSGGLLGVHPALTELLFNGFCDQGLLGWETGNDPPESQDVLGEVRLESDSDGIKVRFLRRGSQDSHDETYIEQALRANISDFSQLRLKVRFRIASHKLGGGGYQGSEYPILLRVDYAYAGGEDYRVFGFYTQNNPQNNRVNRTDNGRQVTPNEWIDFELVDLLGWDPRPVVITRVRLSASGWDFDSAVEEVSLSGL